MMYKLSKMLTDTLVSKKRDRVTANATMTRLKGCVKNVRRRIALRKLANSLLCVRESKPSKDRAN